jgi:hypothetical protein
LKQLDLINQFREILSQVVREVEISSSSSHFDINLVCENLFCGLLKELYGFNKLRNLNADEKKNYPGIDLADDEEKICIQITSDKRIDKIKETLNKIITHNIYQKYNRLIIYCLTKKQDTYSQESIDRECNGKFIFRVNRDIMDYRDLGDKAAKINPTVLKRAVDVLIAYQRGCNTGLADQDFDPPETPQEKLLSNLIELYIPPKLYIAELKSEIALNKSIREAFNQRKAIAKISLDSNKAVPSDYEVNSGRLITFHNLENSNGPFSHLLDEGTVEYLNPEDYYSIDFNYERTFKSLLRFSLQQKLYKHSVMWQHYEKIFIFVPTDSDPNIRIIEWIGKKKSHKKVFERIFKKNKPNEVIQLKHLAFSANFLLLDEGWYIAITPDWFFSWGNDYQRSFYSSKSLSGLKKLERNRSVRDHFRFIAWWLKEIDERNLFSEKYTNNSLTFGNILELKNGRYLNESLWEPLESLSSEEEARQESLIANDD